MHILEFQDLMRKKFGGRDREMVYLFLMSVLTEEVGELARTVRRKAGREAGEEIADIVFCVISLANMFTDPWRK